MIVRFLQDRIQLLHMGCVHTYVHIHTNVTRVHTYVCSCMCTQTWLLMMYFDTWFHHHYESLHSRQPYWDCIQATMCHEQVLQLYLCTYVQPKITVQVIYCQHPVYATLQTACMWILWVKKWILSYSTCIMDSTVHVRKGGELYNEIWKL